ncbi:MAG: CxxxxCH/CxxCH domain-containing protein [Deltaproteobacteria bacterium]|nr:CxxxxCH/CxxCH domain-containing protein [Deltaproteobacteria bacterium]
MLRAERSDASCRTGRLTAGRLAGGSVLFAAIAVAAFLLHPAGGRAGVLGSPHDFSTAGPWTQSTSVAPGGACSPCHIPHKALDDTLWARDLSGYRSKLTLANGRSSLTGRNYLLPPTLRCYDCHDYHNSIDFENPSTPALSLFSTNHRPQDMLFGFTKNGLGSMTEYNAGPQTGKTSPGYYETNPPGPLSSYGVNTSAPLAQTGGHYFKQDPTLAALDAFDNGDKLPCRDCHDPHAWDANWQAFIRRTWPSGSTVATRLGSTATASSVMANDSTPTGRRSDVNSRNLCIACHGTSDTLQSVLFNEISTSYRSDVRIARPPTTIVEHSGSGPQASCVTCHAHNSIPATCNGCHGFPPSDTASPRYPATASSTFVPAPDPGVNDSHPRHYGSKSGEAPNSFSVYAFSCDVCHYGSFGTGAVTLNQHTNSRVSVVLQGAYTKAPNGPGGLYDNTNYFNPAYPTYAGQLDNTNQAGGWGSGARYGGNSCKNVYCHSAGRAQTSMALDCTVDYPRPAWNSGSPGCNGCHGVGTDNTTGGGIYYGMPNYPSGPGGSATANSHEAHVDGGVECSRCHAATVTGTRAGRAIVGTVPSKHVNGVRDVVFDSMNPSGVYDNVGKTCSGTYCHGTPGTLPKWGDPATVVGCSACHQNQGATTGSASYAATHHPHTFNAKLRIACEVCHANKAASHTDAAHAGGPANAATGQSAEVLYTDNASSQTYDTLVFLSRNMWTNPYTGGAVTPSYAGGASYVGNDAVNSNLHYTAGTCGNVWCHTNANPVAWKGVPGQNAYRFPSWAVTCTQCHRPRASDVDCTQCHRGVSTVAAMAGADNLSNAHITHVATDRYKFTCDECHAWTVMNDQDGTSGFGIIAGTGHDNHVNGIKTVKFGTTLRTTTIDQSGGAYDNAAYRCYNTYCHSNGTDNAAFNTPSQWPVDNTISWNSATGGTCTTCHGGSKTSPGPIATGSHARHIASYKCSACHGLTIAASSDNVLNASTGYTYHVNGSKTAQAGDNNTFTYTPGAPSTCTAISCHGGNNAAWGGGPLGCQDCHGGTTDVDDYWYNNGIMAKVQMSGGWDNTGHGRIGSNYASGNPPANDGSRYGSAVTPNCVNFCHDAGQPHIDNTTGNNFFRLATGQGGAGRTAITHATANNVCRQCHDTSYGGSYQAQATRKIGTAHYGSRHSDPNYNGGTFCWDCHDPHGEPSDYMIQGSVATRNDNGVGGIGIPLAVAAVAFGKAGANYTGTDYVKAGFNGLCQACHDPATGIAHFNTSTYDSSHNLGTRCTQCHTHSSNFEAKCVDCHRDSGKLDNNAPTIVWPGGNRSPVPPGTVQGGYGSHLVALKNEPAFSGSTDWNAQCNKCHSGHGGPVQAPMPPTSWTDPSGRLSGTNMAQRLGLENYAVDNGIRLGGSATTGATEAEICWNCHKNAANNVSEWGPGDSNVALAGFPKVQFPTQHDGTPTAFDYGWIWDSAYATKVQDWTSGYWRDEYWWGAGTAADPGLKRRIVSVHSANLDPAGQSSSVAANVNADNTVNYTAPTLENKSSIRCSYCHDVHDLNKAQDPFNTANKETKSGTPYLRGNFISNPYPPDMPPRSGYLYPTTGGPTQGAGAYGNRFRANTTGQVFSEGTPRLFAFTYTTTNVKGGYFIDNNSGDPATGLTQSSVYGLCALCHATSVDGMDFYTGKKLWLGTNGHSNSTLGGTGSNASELFDARRGGTNKYMQMQDGVNVSQWGKNVGYSSNDQGVGAWWNIFGPPQPCDSGGANCPPKNSGWYGGTPGSTTRGAGYATWYGGATPPKPAHRFTCSKCHSPHSSGLPALLVTNCLDIGLANWTGNGGRVGPNAPGTYWTRGPGNCHRKKGTERGWNILAPMQTQ